MRDVYQAESWSVSMSLATHARSGGVSWRVLPCKGTGMSKETKISDRDPVTGTCTPDTPAAHSGKLQRTSRL